MITPLMGLLLPDVNVTLGPIWASELNTALSSIDSHDHTTGKGKKIPLSTGVNINADIDLTSTYNMINARSLRFLNNASVLIGTTDVGCVYEVAGDLWYNNGAGVPVHITSGAGLAFASLGTIGGDYGPGDPAEVSYSALLSEYTFTQDPGVAAAINTGDIYIYDTVLGGKYVHLKVKSGLIANYDFEFPDTLPSSDAVMVLSSTGKVTTTLQSLTAQSMFETGDYKESSKASLSTGWVWASGKTVGDASSNATERANTDTLALFTLYWTDYTDVTLPIYTSAGALSTRGATVGADWSAHKAISIPDRRGRTGVGRDDMGGVAANRITNAECGIVGTTLGASGGDQSHALTNSEIAVHDHAPTNHHHQGPSHGHSFSGYTAGLSGSGSDRFQVDHGSYTWNLNWGTNTQGEHTHSYSGGTANAGTGDTGNMSTTAQGGNNSAVSNGATHTNTQPVYICNVMIKL